MTVASKRPPLRRNLDWQERAACAGTDDPAFVADVFADARPALDMCARCPVAAECLIDGRSRRGWGVWGGHFLREGRPVYSRS